MPGVLFCQKQGGRLSAVRLFTENVKKLLLNRGNLLPGMGVLGGNAEIGVDKWGECGIICVSAGVLLLWRFNGIKTKRPAEI